MRRPPDLFPPRPRRGFPAWAVAASVAAHLTLLVYGAVSGRLSGPLVRLPATSAAPPSAGETVFLLPAPTVPAPVGRARAERPSDAPSDAGAVSAFTPGTTLPSPDATPLLPFAPAGPRDTLARAPTSERLTPGLGDGRLWVRPLPLPPRELAERLGLAKGHVELVDSAVTAIIQTFLDSIAVEPGAQLRKPPRWVTEYAGKTYGIDAGTIYLGDLRIPTAVLAFLPLQMGQPDQFRAQQFMADMQRDLQYAATRATTLDEFKRQIRELRERKEQERAFERNRAVAPTAGR